VSHARNQGASSWRRTRGPARGPDQGLDAGAGQSSERGSREHPLTGAALRVGRDWPLLDQQIIIVVA
jgi:hypothetical protein